MNNFLFIGMPSGSESFVVLVVALLLFGKRLPEVARSMGKSITEFKKGMKDIDDEVQEIKGEVQEVTHEVNKEV